MTDSKGKKVGIILPPELRRRAKVRLSETGGSFQTLFINYLQQWLDGGEAKSSATPAPASDELAALRADPVFGPMLKSLLQAWKASNR